MFDRVFGKVEYDYGWCTPETIELFGKSYDITCVASAYKNEMISRQQRAQYAAFKEKRKEVLVQVEEIIKQYVQKNYADYSGRLKESIIPRELIFHQNGDTGILFDCEWDIETGIVVGIFPQLSIINPDSFL
ncbi:MAG: DUF6985 domain-containing protein [Lachnospiraceae bacterium]